MFCIWFRGFMRSLVEEVDVVDCVAAGQCKGSGCDRDCRVLESRIQFCRMGREDFMEEEIFGRALEGGDDCQDVKGRVFQKEEKVWIKLLRCDLVWINGEIGRDGIGQVGQFLEFGFQVGVVLKGFKDCYRVGAQALRLLWIIFLFQEKNIFRYCVVGFYVII